jgi:hypothetical protein
VCPLKHAKNDQQFGTPDFSLLSFLSKLSNI